MLKYVSKFFLEIFPSIIATVVGAYIVTHYINDKQSDPPKAAAASTSEPVKPETAAKVEQGADKTKQAEKPAEKAAAEKAAADRPFPEKDVKRQAAREKNDKAVAKAVPAANPQPAPVTVLVAPADIASANDDNRDANEIARAALDRLRGPVEAARPPEARPSEPPRGSAAVAVRPAEPPRVTVAVTPPPQQPQVQQTIQPLPPAVLVTPPNAAQTGAMPAAEAPATKHERSFASFRLSPPADIPSAPPLDLQAVSRGHTSVTEDVVSAAKSVFHAVIPR